MSFGVVAGEAGLAPWASVLMSAIVFAGASQFAAVAMLRVGVPAPEIVVATLFLNLRHLVMNLALLPRLGLHRRAARAAIAAGVTDETFAAASFGDPALRSGAGLAGLNLCCWAAWVGGTAAGTALAPLVPEALNQAMGVAIYALFIGLLVPAVRAAPRGLIVALSAMAAHVAAAEVMAPGWAIVAAIVAGASVGAVTGIRREAAHGG